MADLSPLSKAAPKHILHKYFKKIATKSEVIVVDVLMKNEARNVLVGSEYSDSGLVYSDSGLVYSDSRLAYSDSVVHLETHIIIYAIL